VTELDTAKGRLIAAKIEGKYWMYWGEGSIRLATSTDLIHWTPVEDAQGAPIELLRPRSGHFDSTFPETGPPPIETSAGLLCSITGRTRRPGAIRSWAHMPMRRAKRCSIEEPGAPVGAAGSSCAEAGTALRKTGQYIAGLRLRRGWFPSMNGGFFTMGAPIRWWLL